ncbi:MAG: ABC transporter permease [Bacteroidota bacterium]|nr:ABC transporter permease [Bacteroidota bacterium]
MNKIALVAKREFLSRVQKKTFLLTTILLPLLIFVFYAMIIYFSVKTEDRFTIAVADNANILNNKLENKKDDINFTIVHNTTAAQLDEQLQQKKCDGYIIIPADYDLMGRDSLQLKSGKAIGIMTREKIQKLLNDILEEKRLMALNISKAKIDSIQNSNQLQFTTLGGKKETDTKAGISYGVGYISGFLIYIILFIYGTMVMRGVMEEKTNRIAEVIVSSVKPFQLMMGKITGIGAVGLIQFIIWIVLVIGLQMILPLLFPDLLHHTVNTPMQPGAMQAAQAANNSGAIHSIMQGLNDVNFPLIIGCFIFYFLGGYFLYASLFAAVGSAVNEDPQDAQSLLLPITMPIIFAMVIMTKAVNDPNSSLAVFGSLFPLTSPIVMMARIAHGIPDGVSIMQLVLSMGLLIAGFLGTTWLAGKIYRTGILLYGKKPSWKEMWKWAFRKS